MTAKNMRDEDVARIDSTPQDKPGQVSFDNGLNKSWMYVQNNGAGTAVVDEFAVQKDDGLPGSAVNSATDALSDTVNGQMVCLGVWESAVPVGSYGYAQKTGDRATLTGSTVTAGIVGEVATAAVVGTLAIAGQPYQYLALDGTAVRLSM